MGQAYSQSRNQVGLIRESVILIIEEVPGSHWGVGSISKVDFHTDARYIIKKF